MNLHHDALVLVADGQKYLILRNDGDVRAPRLVVEGGAERAGQPARAFGDDRPGRSFSQAGGTPSALAQADHHQMAEDDFAVSAAAALAGHAERLAAADCIVVAPPRTLATLRRHYSRAVQAWLAAEVDKDLTGHGVDAIARILAG